MGSLRKTRWTDDMREAYQKLWYHPRYFGPLTRATLSSLSLLGLLKHDGNIMLPSLLASLVEAYSDGLNYLVTENIPFWAVSAVDIVKHVWVYITGDTLTLYSHWTHVLALMGIYFFKQSSDVSEMVQTGTGYWKMSYLTKVTYYAVGAFSALLAGVAAGTTPLNGDILASARIVAVVILGVLAYDLITSFFGAFTLRHWLSAGRQDWNEWFLGNAFESMKRTAIGILSSATLLAMALALEIRNPAITILLILVMMLGVYWTTKSNEYSLVEGDPKSHYAIYGSSLGLEMLLAFVVPGTIVLAHFLQSLI